ncbi:MAG: Lrp/AsnC family transcriptional regulator [Halobacteriaceae archaeon]
MVQAFVMVKTDAGESENTHEDLLEIEGIDEAHIVAGDFDIIAEIQGDEIYDILHAAAAEIQKLTGVTDTKTYISLS